jgi:hypothetical protein
MHDQSMQMTYIYYEIDILITELISLVAKKGA